MSNDFPQPLDAAVIPRFAGIPSFMRLPIFTNPADVQIALLGVPWYGGTTNRAGARHGPREVRNQSSMMRKVHHVSHIAPYDLVRVGDLGDAPVNPIDLIDSLKQIEAFYRQVHEVGTVPLSVGGDHLVTLPIFRAIARERPVGMVHFDVHSDTNDRYFGDNLIPMGRHFAVPSRRGYSTPNARYKLAFVVQFIQPKTKISPRPAAFVSSIWKSSPTSVLPQPLLRRDVSSGRSRPMSHSMSTF